MGVRETPGGRSSTIVHLIDDRPEKQRINRVSGRKEKTKSSRKEKANSDHGALNALYEIDPFVHSMGHESRLAGTAEFVNKVLSRQCFHRNLHWADIRSSRRGWESDVVFHD
jgi:hypothetical protein